MNTASLKWILGIAGTLGAIILLFLLIFYRETAFIYAFLLGLSLSLINFIILTKMVAKFLGDKYKRKSLWAALLLGKLLLIGGILFVAFELLALSVPGFSLGFFCLIPAIVLGQFKG